MPSALRDNTFLALESGSACWLIDCGPSPYQRLLQVGLRPSSLRGVILTHSHADHIYGLPALLFQLALAGYDGLLDIYGLPETLLVVRRVVEAFSLGEHCAAHCWRGVEVDEDSRTDLFEEEGVRVGVVPVRHSRPAVGVRIEGIDGGIIAYSGDTGPCQGVRLLAAGAHWLLHECTADQAVPGHSRPEDIAQVAHQAEVERLGIVHYDPRYVVASAVLRERIRRAGYKGEIRILGDLDNVQWRGRPSSGAD